MEKPQPRKRYEFEYMKKNDVKRIHVPDDDTQAGARALCAAYAYGRRNDWKFCGATDVQRGKTYMLIRRIA